MTSRPHPNQRPAASLPPELRRTTVPAEVRHWIAREAGTVVRVRRVPGASTTAVHAVVLSDGRRLVLRRFVWRWVLEDEPVVPQREVDALRFADGVLVDAHGQAELLEAPQAADQCGVLSGAAQG